MTDAIVLPPLDAAQTIELARMLLARKLMPEDRRGLLSPMVNAPLAQSVILVPQCADALMGWLPRLRDQFVREMADKNADPSLSRHLAELPDDKARTNLIRQYFLPFQASGLIDLGSVEAIAKSFGAAVGIMPAPPDMGPLYPGTPQDGAIGMPTMFARSIFDQVLLGRHSHIHLETRRRGDTDATASDTVIQVFLQVFEATKDGAATAYPFHNQKLRHDDFARSFAYTQMMDLGFSHEEMMAAMRPWQLVD